jgi:dolichol-phosphate mannosyltransferase
VESTLIIIPTFNEKENISAIIQKVLLTYSHVNILVVDDGSPDGTAQIVQGLQREEFPKRLHLIQRQGKLGLGTAYITGFKYALDRAYKYVIEMDADFSHNPIDLPKLYNACADRGADVSLGSRYKNGVNVVNWPMHRVLMSFFASKYVRFITGLPLNDATAGFVCYKRSVLESLNLDAIKFVGYAFQVEMKFKAWKKGFNIEEVPIIFTDRTAGESKMSIKIFREAVLGMVDLKIQSIFKSPSKF